MNEFKSNLFYAVVLILFSIWEYYSALNPSIVHLLPLFFGVIFLSLNNGVQYGLKGQTKAALVLSVFSLIVVMYIFGNLFDRNNNLSIFRYAVIMLSGIISIFYLLKSVNRNA
jgi:hypothetical protein